MITVSKAEEIISKNVRISLIVKQQLKDCYSIPISGSGDYISLARGHGFVEPKADQRYFTTNTLVPLYRW